MTFASVDQQDLMSFATTPMPPQPHHRPEIMPASSFMTDPAPPMADSWNPTHQDMRPAVMAYDTAMRMTDEAMIDAIVFLSVAEEALRKTTRTATPPKCWGCHGIAKIHEDRWRLFRECPHKHRSDVQTQFRKHAREYKAFMEAKRTTGSTDLYRPGASIIVWRQTISKRKLPND
jgi:hypothetical protein